MSDEKKAIYTIEELMQRDLRDLDRELRTILESIEFCYAILGNNMESIIERDLEGEITALGDNEVAELLTQIENRIRLVIQKARHNVHGEPG